MTALGAGLAWWALAGEGDLSDARRWAARGRGTRRAQAERPRVQSLRAFLPGQRRAGVDADGRHRAPPPAVKRVGPTLFRGGRRAVWIVRSAGRMLLSGEHFPLPLQVSAADLPAGRFVMGVFPVHADRRRRRDRRRHRRADHVSRSRGCRRPARSDRARRAAARRARRAALLPVPADADPQGRGPAAELPRRPGRRLAQHDDRRPRRPAAQPVRAAASSPDRTPRCSTRCRSDSSCGSSASRRRPTASRRPPI